MNMRYHWSMVTGRGHTDTGHCRAESFRDAAEQAIHDLLNRDVAIPLGKCVIVRSGRESESFRLVLGYGGQLELE